MLTSEQTAGAFMSDWIHGRASRSENEDILHMCKVKSVCLCMVAKAEFCTGELTPELIGGPWGWEVGTHWTGSAALIPNILVQIGSCFQTFRMALGVLRR